MIVLGALSWVTDKGYDKIMPRLQEQQEQAVEAQRQHSELIRKGLEEMGASPEAIEAALTPPTPEEMTEYSTTGPSPRRPIGTWIGVKKGDETNTAIMRFEKNRYWLTLENTSEGAISEKGRYIFEIDAVRFMPENGEEYTMEYYMVSTKGIQFFDGRNSFDLDKTEQVEIDF
jgi:hypothetical protein